MGFKRQGIEKTLEIGENRKEFAELVS